MIITITMSIIVNISVYKCIIQNGIIHDHVNLTSIKSEDEERGIWSFEYLQAAKDRNREQSDQSKEWPSSREREGESGEDRP